MVALSAYELARLERIQANEAVLASLDPKRELRELEAQQNAAKQLKRKVAAEARARTALAKAERARQQPKRASARQAGEPARYTPTMDDGTPSVVKGARYQYLELPSRARGPAKRKAPLAPLSDANRLALSAAEDWLGDFEHFLTHTLNDSDQNRRQVLKQATKLASGQGVPHPRAEATFHEGVVVTLGDDFLALIDEAQEWEDANGEDFGHGWLLRHPLKKLHIYQAFRSDRDSKTQGKATTEEAPSPPPAKKARVAVTPAAPARKQPHSAVATKAPTKASVPSRARSLFPKKEPTKAVDELAGASLVGQAVKVHWPEAPYNGWFQGVVDSFSVRKGVGFHKVVYVEDGVETWEMHRFDRVQYSIL